jgi:hypothetical protein
MLIQRSKYYTGWKMSQSGIIFCGLSYNPTPRPKTQPAVLTVIGGEIEHKFDKVESAGISIVEFDINPKKRIQYWNRTVHLWLKYNLFLRIVSAKSKVFNGNNSIASLITFMVSAFWHGFYPVYYIFFFIFYIYEQACDMLTKLGFFDYFENQGIIVEQGMGLLTMFLCNYLGIVFVNLTVKNFYDFTVNMGFVPVIMIFGSFVVGKVLLMKQKGNRTKEE